MCYKYKHGFFTLKQFYQFVKWELFFNILLINYGALNGKKLQ